MRTPSCDDMVITPDILVTKSRCESFVILNSVHEEAVRQVRDNQGVLSGPENPKNVREYLPIQQEYDANITTAEAAAYNAVLTTGEAEIENPQYVTEQTQNCEEQGNFIRHKKTNSDSMKHKNIVSGLVVSLLSQLLPFSDLSLTIKLFTSFSRWRSPPSCGSRTRTSTC